jgi:Na+/H+-dicarboxylate symporter
MFRRLISLPLHWQIVIALVLAAVAGTLAGTDSSFLGVNLFAAFDFIGQLFLNALRMLIVPLIASSIIVGAAGIGGSDRLGSLGGRTLAFYGVTTLLAIMIGLTLVNLVQPGVVDGQPAGEILGLENMDPEAAAGIEGRGAGDIVNIFLRMIPTNVVQAAANTELLGLIFFCLLFGVFMARSGHASAEVLYKFWDGVFHVMMAITELVMKFAPIGVFGLVAAVVANTGFGGAEPLIKFSLVVIAGLLIHAVVTLPLLIRYAGGAPRPYKIFPAMAPAMLTAFSTSSSSATLPVTMDCVERNAGVSNQVSSFVLPLGATVNMNGTALYECAAALFIAQAYGFEITFMTQFLIVVTALVTSIGVAGVPSASLVAIGIILTTVGLPIEAIGVLFVFDRILDMCRTSVNILGDASCAVIVARQTGEPDVLDPPEDPKHDPDLGHRAGQPGGEGA